MTLYQIITSVLAQNGNNANLAELKKHTGNRLLADYLVAVMSPRINFFIKKLPTPKAVGTREFDETVLTLIVDTLSNRKLTGKAAIEYIETWQADLNAEGQQLLAWMIDKGFRGGLGTSIVNKAFGRELIWDNGNHYMRCSLPTPKLIDKFDWNNAIVQLKYDGAYHEAGNAIGVRTRSGNTYPAESCPIDPTNIDGIVMGELVVYNGDKKLDRKTSNGIVNSALSGTQIPDGYKAVFHVWDWRPEDSDCDIPYYARLLQLETIAANNPQLVVAESIRVVSYQDALAEAGKLIAAGEEGAILKDINAPWKAGTSKQQIKLKVECDVDLLATELVAGDANGKHKDTFGSIRCQTSDGKLVVDVSGISDAQRQQIADNPDSIIGKIVTVTFNDIIDSRSNDTASLFLPRFGNKVNGEFVVRPDKTTADSLERVLEIFEAATGIRKELSL